MLENQQRAVGLVPSQVVVCLRDEALRQGGAASKIEAYKSASVDENLEHMKKGTLEPPSFRGTLILRWRFFESECERKKTGRKNSRSISFEDL